MYEYVYAYVCIYVRMYVCMYVCKRNSIQQSFFLTLPQPSHSLSLSAYILVRPIAYQCISDRSWKTSFQYDEFAQQTYP